ncbi:LOW QUALITY PROTEIN: HHIP-like protein 2 [Ammospiza maritima maritima]
METAYKRQDGTCYTDGSPSLNAVAHSFPTSAHNTASGTLPFPPLPQTSPPASRAPLCLCLARLPCCPSRMLWVRWPPLPGWALFPAGTLPHSSPIWSLPVPMLEDCSPYAAHLYDAENLQTPLRSLPGLCIDYFYSAIRLLTGDKHIQECCKTNRTHFCHLLQLQDEDYCFPQVLQNLSLSCCLGLLLEQCGGCVQLCLAEVASGLRNPVLIARAADGTHRAFTAEQLGLIRACLPNGSWLEEPFLDIQSLLLAAPWLADKRGFHPKQKDKGEFYICYTWLENRVGKIRINELKVLASDANKIDPSSERILLELEEPAAKDPFGKFGNAQNKSTLLGKVLRTDVDGRNPDGKPYHIPPDNPFMSDPKACPGVYAYGVRKWCCAMDRGDPITKKGRGRIFCGDVGNRFEEINLNLIVKGGNYGWRAKEVCSDTKLCRNSSMDDTLPIFAYGCSVGKSVTGGFVYRGCESPNLNGLYISGDFLSSFMALQEDKKTNKWKKEDISVGSTSSTFPGMISSYSKFIISFAEDEAGELYFMSTSYPSAYTPHGSLYKLIYPASRKCTGIDSKPHKLLLPKHCQGHCHVPDGNSDFPRNLPGKLMAAVPFVPISACLCSRRAAPGKCKYKAVPLKTESKWIPFLP